MTVFTNGERRKTRKFEEGINMVKCINGEIMLSAGDPNLIIVNEELETKKSFKLAEEIDFSNTTNNDSMSCNETFIAVGYENYVSCYRRRGSMEPMVSRLDF